uniref:Methyl-CpG binding domain protein 1b n=1 Tax=Gasterosteus aculeatus TaxID=69293 RepID=G3PEK1_GASAC
RPRRKRSHPDEGWDEWPILGDGWKRKEVVRRSGSSIGQKDVYYLSPRGERVRSRVELISLMVGQQDMSTFDYKSGIPNKGSRNVDVPAQDRIKLPRPSSSRALLLPSINGEVGSEDSTLVCARCGLSFTGTWYDKQRKRPCCPNCWAASKSKEHPLVRFRKWIPCGQCVGCHNTVNCGQCANCKHGLQSPESRKRLCRKRKCICPIRKQDACFLCCFCIDAFCSTRALEVEASCRRSPLMTFLTCMRTALQSEVTDSQVSFSFNTFCLRVNKVKEKELPVSLRQNDDDMITKHKKRKRRSCGECKACLCRKDCGTCDFCVDKPKFGGSNKKRQKCRLRQCQRQAMVGLHFGPRPHYTYSRKSLFKRNRGSQYGLDFTDNDEDDCNLKPQLSSVDFTLLNGLPHISSDPNNSELVCLLPSSCLLFLILHFPPLDQRCNRSVNVKVHMSIWEEGEDEEEEVPMITQIFSLAETPSGSGDDVESQLTKLLQSLRSSAMPILWYSIMVEGPQLQLVQCSKQSSLSDTIVLIDPGFCYQVTVQKQPLLPTHSLYDRYPARLTSVTEVVDLLLGLEEYVVCQGL